MSVARREWKRVDELRAWIAHGVRVTAPSREWERVPELEIVYQPPQSGKSNWRVRDPLHAGGVGWSVAMQSVITRAQLQFDLR